MTDDYGWKQVHGDVFRQPTHISVLAALVGTGWQLTLLAIIVLLFTIISDLYTEYGMARIMFCSFPGHRRLKPFLLCWVLDR